MNYKQGVLKRKINEKKKQKHRKSKEKICKDNTTKKDKRYEKERKRGKKRLQIKPTKLRAYQAQKLVQTTGWPQSFF